MCDVLFSSESIPPQLAVLMHEGIQKHMGPLTIPSRPLTTQYKSVINTNISRGTGYIMGNIICDELDFAMPLMCSESFVGLPILRDDPETFGPLDVFF